jgi:hypothetical protein
MLKNKKAIYILIPLNLFIWGFFAYRIYTSFNSTDEELVEEQLPAFKTQELKDSIDYVLKLNYPDPFLRDVATYRGNNAPNAYSTSNTTPSVKPVAPKTPTNSIIKQVPEIKFLGLVKNTTSGITTALVSINGQTKLIKQNDVQEGITFKSVNRDSIVAKWGKERIVVKR